MKLLYTFPGFRIEAGGDWRDITHTLHSPGKPFTLAKEDGVGALQFSPALYRRGPLPCATKEGLLSMTLEFGQCRGLGEAL
jgi:hypothetical protein